MQEKGHSHDVPSDGDGLLDDTASGCHGDVNSAAAIAGGSRLRLGAANGLRAATAKRGDPIRPERLKLVVDALMLGAAMAAVVLTAAGADDPVESPVWLVAVPAVVLALFARRGTYRPRIAPRFLDEVAVIFATTAVAVMGIIFVRILFTEEAVPGSQGLREWVLAASLLTAGRAGVTASEMVAIRRGRRGRPTLIAGAGHVGHLVARRLLARPEIGLYPVGFLDSDPRAVEEPSGVPVIDSISDLESTVLELGVVHAIICFSGSSHDDELAALARLQQLGVSVSIVPRLFEGLPDRVILERLGALPLVSIYPSNARGWRVDLKYALDRVLAVLAVLLASPLLILAALGVLLSAGRPVLFRQRRVGVDGREFDMLKFRTMRGQPDDEEAFAAGAAKVSRGIGPGGVEGVDRRTGFGKLLRRASLDELPQLFNVVVGEMSIVGPRPERPEWVRAFEGEVRRYSLRHRVKSGITGWAQVHGLRGKTPVAERVEYDNYYIENWSPWLDVKIILLTVLAVFRRADD